MDHVTEKLYDLGTFSIMALASLITDGTQQNTLFFLGILVAVARVSQSVYAIYTTRKNNKTEK